MPNIEHYRILGTKVNELGGTKIYEEVKLDDLLYIGAKAGSARGNPPKLWIDIISKLNHKERRTVTSTMAKANRIIAIIKRTDPTIRDIRRIKTEKLDENIEWSRRWDYISPEGIQLLEWCFNPLDID